MSSPDTDTRRSIRRPRGMTKLEAARWELDRAVPDGSCLITRAAKVGGYGYITVGRKVYRLNRLVLESRLGRSLAADEQANHTCHRPACINPDHLYAGTHADNMRDRAYAGHYSDNGRAPYKLTDEQVQDIRRRCADGVLQKDLAAEHGVSISHISMLVNRLRRFNP